MEFKIETKSQIKKEISTTVPYEELIPHFEKAFTEQQKKIELPGFRKGKVPIQMIKKVYGESIQYRELDNIANDYYKKIVKENNLKVVGEPILEDINYETGKDFSFKIKVETLPEFELKNLKGIDIEHIPYNVTDEDMEKEIQYLRHLHATNEDVQVATDDEHIVTFEIQEVDANGNPIIGNKVKDIQVRLSDEEKLLEIRNGLKNCEVGKSYKITYMPQQGERQEPIDGEFFVKKIQKISLPKVDDEFVKKITKEKVLNVDEFKPNLKLDLENFWKEKNLRNFEDKIADKLVNAHDFEIPEAMIKGFGDGILEDYKSKLQNKTLPKNFDDKKFREENRSYCIWQAKWFLLRDKIREELKLTVEESDLEKIAEAESQKIGIEKSRLLTYYKNSKSAHERILNEKMFEFLISNANVSGSILENAETQEKKKPGRKPKKEKE